MANLYPKYFDLKNELNKISQNLIVFKDSSQNLYDDNAISSLVKIFSQSNEMVQKTNQTFLSITARPIKVIEVIQKVTKNI